MSEVDVEIPAGLGVQVTSSTNAGAKQRYQVWRTTDRVHWYLLDTISGGGAKQYPAFNVTTVYRIHIEAWYDKAHPTQWMPSSTRRSTINSGRTTMIESEDYWSTDNDWNDCIVYVNSPPWEGSLLSADHVDPYHSESARDLRNSNWSHQSTDPGGPSGDNASEPSTKNTGGAGDTTKTKGN